MTLTDMMALVRKDLHDEDSQNYRWTDAVLTRHINHAVKEFSEALPLQSKAVMATIGGSRELSLAALTGRVMVEAVEYPAGQYPAVYNRFGLWGDTLTLLGEAIPDGSNCHIYYGQLHTLGATSTIPAVYDDLITWGACGYAALEMAMYTLNRVNNGGQNTPEALSGWGQQKLLMFRAELKRLGRRNRVRVNRLYAPAAPPQSRATDPGPFP
jgi:hypothetical protein